MPGLPRQCEVPSIIQAVRILLVDDDAELCDLLREYFAGHEVALEVASDGNTALARLSKDSTIDAVLLDVMLPGPDGFTICKRIREASKVPVIMLTARGDDDDRIVGLDLGADDYVPKPFNPRELLSRLRAVLRRAKSDGDSQTTRLVVGDLVIDVPAQKVSLGNDDLVLTSFEFRLLVALARRAGDTVRRSELATALEFGTYDPSVDRSLDVHISHLRSKLQDDARDPKRIRTVRGIGYVLVRPS
jgi:DNA-binding response OmpR family regulator